MKIYLLLLSLFLTACGKLEQIPYDPPLPSENWCRAQPCWTCGDWVISQPSSSIIVYILAFCSIWIGCFFLTTSIDKKARFWWGISILLGGIGALCAGTSFQAFGYMIKCADAEYCAFSSWWEIVYNILTVWGSGALLIAISFSSMQEKGQHWSRIYALLNAVVYTGLVLYGVQTANRFLISFECMILSTIPAYLVIVLLHIYQYIVAQYITTSTILLKYYLGCWSLFALTALGYILYQQAELTQWLWERNIWFSENDVLHVLMLLWCWYTHKVLGKHIKD